MTRKRTIVFFDASALAKRYSSEKGTSLVNDIFRSVPRTSIACSVVGIAESYRSWSAREMTADWRKIFSGQLWAEFVDQAETLVVPIEQSLIFRSLNLILDHHINANDAIILRSLLDMKELLRGYEDVQTDVVFVNSDKRLARATRKEGIGVFDPEIDSLEDFKRVVGLPEEWEH